MRIISRRIWKIFPSFRLAYLISLTVLLSFILWIVFDCSFRWVPWIVSQDLRLQFLHDPALQDIHSFFKLRLSIFILLALLGLISLVIVFSRLIFGTERERSIKAMLYATLLVAIWLAFFTSYKQLWWYTFRYRILHYQDAMKTSMEILSKKWPTESVDLPGLGTYVLADRHPNLLYIDGPGPNGLTDFFEKFDRISKNEEGEYNFAVGSYTGCWIHYMKKGHSPHSYSRQTIKGFISVFDLQQVVEIDENWYLAYYKISTSDKTPILPLQEKPLPDTVPPIQLNE
jgi:hypothetical protein